MAALDTRSVLTSAFLVLLIVGGIYILDPTLAGLLPAREGFANGNTSTMGANANFAAAANQNTVPGPVMQVGNTNGNPNVLPTPNATNVNMNNNNNTQGFADLSTFEGPSSFGDAQAPAGCYPRDQLTPSELLPKDPNSVWAQQNPMGSGSLKGKNFLSAGALIGINTVGQSMRNANYQLRSEPPNPQVPVSVFLQSTIEPDANRRTLEIN
jgi:hypothetical protein